ncbi:homeobox protein invected-like [Drosophila tropicalis]|uniref:homeobox protein invected-like n=1 Tax=Drosophila tropicalis TaxID=46794 RepID=UPI0035AC15F5
MSTLARSCCRPSSIHLKSEPQLAKEEDEEEAEQLNQREMHPDCLPMPLAQHISSPQVEEADADEEEDNCDEHLNIEDAEEDEEEADLDLEDPASCCSETSVLSVGQEQSQAAAAAVQAQAEARQRLLMSQLYRPSAFTNVEESSSLSMPAPANSFQEEFLRKSQLYAEELMKQQMQLMAAARVNALTAVGKMSSQLQMAAAAAALVVPTGQDALAQLTATALGMAPTQQLIMPHHQQQQQQHQHQQHLHPNSNHHPQQRDPLHNNNNHNNNNNENLHERALKFSIDNILKADFGSRLQQQFAAAGAGGNSGGLARIPSSTNSSSCSPLKPPKKSTKPLNLAQTNAVTSSLSFSSTLANICSNSNDSNSTATSSSTTATSNAVDLAKSPLATSPAPPGGSTTAAGGAGGGAATNKTGEDSSGTPIVWPAWVYCTRYSDRPSSGLTIGDFFNVTVGAA